MTADEILLRLGSETKTTSSSTLQSKALLRLSIEPIVSGTFNGRYITNEFET